MHVTPTVNIIALTTIQPVVSRLVRKEVMVFNALVT